MTKKKFKHYINYIAVQIAIGSICIGILSLLLLKNNGNTGLVGIGYCLVIAVAITNSAVLVPMLINTLRSIKDFKEHAYAILLVCINIPFASWYLKLI